MVDVERTVCQRLLRPVRERRTERGAGVLLSLRRFDGIRHVKNGAARTRQLRNRRPRRARNAWSRECTHALSFSVEARGPERSNPVCSHPLPRGTTICLHHHGENAAKRTCANVAYGSISSARDMSSTVSRYSRALGGDVNAEKVRRWSLRPIRHHTARGATTAVSELEA